MLLSVMMVYKYWDSITVRNVWLGIGHLLIFDIARGSRVFGRLQGCGVGGQGPTFGRTGR